MILRRVVTDTHSIDLMDLEDRKVVKVSDLETGASMTYAQNEFVNLIELGKMINYYLTS
jgi:hypothetical protein